MRPPISSTQRGLEWFGDRLSCAYGAAFDLGQIVGLVLLCWLWVPLFIVSELFWHAMDRAYGVRKPQA